MLIVSKIFYLGISMSSVFLSNTTIFINLMSSFFFGSFFIVEFKTESVPKF